MTGESEHRVCPECGGEMIKVTEANGRVLYKCHNFDCGILILIDKETGKELQRWSRNG